MYGKKYWGAQRATFLVLAALARLDDAHGA